MSILVTIQINKSVNSIQFFFLYGEGGVLKL